MKKIILASASPRRKKLLAQTGFKFEVDRADIDETIDPKLTPLQLVKKLSLKKAQIIGKKYRDAIIISADTIISLAEKAIGKPKDKKDAIRILKFLSGKIHYVITAFTILNTQSKKIVTKAVKTKIFFRKLSHEEIYHYVTTAKILDKAGAYAIQELGRKYIEKIEGDYTNVIGLPIHSLKKELGKFGIKPS